MVVTCCNSQLLKARRRNNPIREVRVKKAASCISASPSHDRAVILQRQAVIKTTSYRLEPCAGGNIWNPLASPTDNPPRNRGATNRKTCKQHEQKWQSNNKTF